MLQMAKRKYGNHKVKAYGHTFDSKAEFYYYQKLKLLEKAGEVESFEMQKRFMLLEKFKHPATDKTIRSITYTPDFIVNYADGSTIIVDVKGTRTAVFNLKAKMFMERYGVPLILAKYNYNTGRFTHEPA